MRNIMRKILNGFAILGMSCVLISTVWADATPAGYSVFNVSFANISRDFGSNVTISFPNAQENSTYTLGYNEIKELALNQSAQPTISANVSIGGHLCPSGCYWWNGDFTHWAGSTCYNNETAFPVPSCSTDGTFQSEPKSKSYNLTTSIIESTTPSFDHFLFVPSAATRFIYNNNNEIYDASNGIPLQFNIGTTEILGVGDDEKNAITPPRLKPKKKHIPVNEVNMA